jgi:hypothetical protein
MLFFSADGRYLFLSKSGETTIWEGEKTDHRALPVWLPFVLLLLAILACVLILVRRLFRWKRERRPQPSPLACQGPGPIQPGQAAPAPDDLSSSAGRLERGRRWCKRNLALAASLGAGGCLLVGSIVALELSLRASAQKHELEEANDRQLSSTAVRLVWPLGVRNNLGGRSPQTLSDPEIEALWELGGTAEEKLRLRFVAEAIRLPLTRRQLRSRAGFAIHAAVGLDARRREAVERMLVVRLSGKEAPLAEGADLSFIQQDLAFLLNQSEPPLEEKADLALILAMLGDVEPQTARLAAETLIQAMSKRVDDNPARVMDRGLENSSKGELARGLATVAARLEAKEAAATLTQAMNKTTDPNALRVLAAGLTAVATRLEPKEAAEARGQAAAALTRAMSQTTDRDRLAVLMQGVVAVAALLEPKEAKEAAANIIQAMSQTTDSLVMAALAQSLVPVAAQLDSKEAQEAATIITQALTKANAANELGALVQSLAAVLTRESSDRRLQRFRSVPSSIGLMTSPAALPLALAVLAPTLEPPPEPVPAQVLVEVLKDPLCVGTARRAVLDVLGTRYQRTFTDQWDFIRFANEQQLGLDLSSPPKRPARTAKPGTLD